MVLLRDVLAEALPDSLLPVGAGLKFPLGRGSETGELTRYGAEIVDPLHEAVLAWLTALLDDPATVEAVARQLAGMDSDDDWPSNEILGGSLTGTRDDEYRAAMGYEARGLLAVVRERAECAR